MKDDEVFNGKKLKTIRKAKKVSQKELAKLADMSLSAVQSYEDGRYAPKIGPLKRICKALEISQEYLFGTESNNRNQMTLEEAIKYCEEVADTCTDKQCADDHYQLATWLKMLKRILSSGDCNICGIRKVCQLKPNLGEQVRYNCPLFVKEEPCQS